jgi:hypothetical protein
MSIIHESRNFLNIEGLVSDLEIAISENRRLLESDASDDQCLPSHKRGWAIRAAINATQARTLAELTAKARAAEIALSMDPTTDCDCPGSFVELSRSILADLAAMASRGAALDLAKRDAV